MTNFALLCNDIIALNDLSKLFKWSHSLTRLGIVQKTMCRQCHNYEIHWVSKWPYALKFFLPVDEGRVIMSPPLFQLFSLFFLRFFTLLLFSSRSRLRGTMHTRQKSSKKCQKVIIWILAPKISQLFWPKKLDIFELKILQST